jgi:hypothetical protein
MKETKMKEIKFKETKLPHGCWLHESPSGDKFYFRNLEFHREDGPAIELANGNKSWYLNDIQIPCKTQEEFERIMRLKTFW